MEEIKRKDSTWYNKWEKEPFTTRFPGGESYFDLMHRLEMTLIEIEQQTVPVLLVGHRSVLQILYSYFAGIDIRTSPTIDIPHGVVIEFIPHPGGSFSQTRHYLDGSERIEVVSNDEGRHFLRPHVDSLESEKDVDHDHEIWGGI